MTRATSWTPLTVARAGTSTSVTQVTTVTTSAWTVRATTRVAVGKVTRSLPTQGRVKVSIICDSARKRAWFRDVTMRFDGAALATFVMLFVCHVQTSMNVAATTGDAVTCAATPRAATSAPVPTV